MNLEQLIAQMQEQLASALQLKAEQQKAQQRAVHPDSTNHNWQLTTHAVELAGAKVAFEVVERLCQNCAHSVLQIPAAQFITRVIENCPGAQQVVQDVEQTVEQDVVSAVDNFAGRYREDTGTPHDEPVQPQQPQQPQQPNQQQSYQTPNPVAPVQNPLPFGQTAPSGVNPFAPPSGSLTPPPGATVGEPLRTS